MEDKVHISTSAYQHVISKLNELQLHDITNYLQQNVTNGATNNEERSEMSQSSECSSLGTTDDDSSREDNFHTKLQVVKTPLVINVRKATKFRDNHMETYTMRGNPRGIVLIIANNLYETESYHRPGAKHDEVNLKQLFENMGFKVLTHSNLSGKQIDETIYNFSKMAELKKADSAFIIISSHGKGEIGVQETEIYGVDYDSPGYKKVVCTNIINYFTANNCKNLQGKPKIFIFQTCRGNNEQYAVSRYTADNVTSSKPRIKEQQYVCFSDTLRDYEDMLMVYSTIPGYVSYRDKFNGSWFIQILCEVFMNHAYKFHVQDLFSMIDCRLKHLRTPFGNCQTASVTVRGFKKCFLNPGLFRENNQINGNVENNPNTIADAIFKCCPDRRVNVVVCLQCESIYHYKCAKKLDHVQFINKVKVHCCSSNGKTSSDETDCKSLSENVEELKKILCDLREENHHLKEQVTSLQTQHVQIISNEIDLKNYEETLRKQNLIQENNLLKQLVDEMTGSNELLKEKNEMLTKKLNKKNACLRQRLGRVLKRKRKRPSNTVEPENLD